jgi:ATP-binding cassette subfamily B protein
MSSVDATSLENFLETEEREQRRFQNLTFSQSTVRMMRLILKHPRPFLGGATLIVLGTCAAILEPRIFGYAIDEAILPGRWERLKGVGLVLFLTIGVRISSAIQQTYLFEVLGQRVTQDLRLQLFSQLERLSLTVHAKHPPGRLLTRVTNDIASLNEMFSSGFVSMFCNLLLVLGTIIGLLVLDFQLAAISLSVFPVLVILSFYFSKRLIRAYQDSRSKLSALNAFLAENLSGMKIVHLFNRQDLHFSRLNRLNFWYAEAQTASVRVYALFQPTITICAGISVALAMLFGGERVLHGQLKLGVLVAFFSYLMALFQPVREIADKWNIFLSGMTAAERIFSILDWPVEMASDQVETRPQLIDGIMGKIQFENVWFAYQGENWVLKDFSLEVQAGERIGVVGYTGSGKTTLIHLLMRFYDPQRGRILLDGRDLRTYDLRSLRASIGMVQQDVFLFSGTFEENITFWKPSLDDRVQDILSELQLEAQSGKTLLEKGVNFSMGERQMIAFARALAIEPRIWILDEATANLDSRTEEVLQKAVTQAAQGKTSFFIAHRLATVQSADRILVLHQGHLVESGTHSELVEQGGVYSRLYRLQGLG